MAFSPQFLDQLRGRVGLADLIGRRVRLTRKGREHHGLCPFHKEKTPSFTVNEDKGFYHCFGCGAHGGAFDFVMHTDGLNFPEAVERLALDAGMEVPADTPQERQRARQRKTLYDVTEAAAKVFQASLRSPAGKGAMDYLRRRGLDDAVIQRFRLGFAEEGALRGALAGQGIPEDSMVEAGLLKRSGHGGPPYEYFRRRLVFPIADKRGRVIAFGGRILGDGEPKYLNSPETPLFQKGRTLYGLDLAAGPARTKGGVVVAEGYMDVIALHRAGYENTVAPLGTALTEDQIRELWRLAPEPVLCFDGDAAGQRAAGRAAERVLPLLRPGFGLKFAELPEGQDPDSLIIRDGPEAIGKVLASAQPLSDVLWQMETQGRLVSSPEDRAALEKRLQDHARRIDDATVRAHFRQRFRDRLWRRRPAPRRESGFRASLGQPTMRMDAKAGPAARVDPVRQAQKVLLAIIIHHPAFFHRVEESLGTAYFLDDALDRLRRGLISLLSGDHDLDVQGLRDGLRDMDLGGVVDGLFRDPLVKTHRMIGPGAADEDIQATWDQNLHQLQNAQLAREKEKVKDTLTEEFTEDRWRRDRALIEAALEDTGREDTNR